jgi:hypothetical protein
MQCCALMQIEKIVTLANASTQLQLHAMVRSLRAVSCTLPVWVIPYDDTRCDLPDACEWWVEPNVLDWLDSVIAHPMMRKYQCLTTRAYQYVDTDVIFLRDPARVLRPYDGLVTACTEWNKPRWTVTESSRALMAGSCSTWQRRVFNAGQFASENSIYTLEELKALAADPEVAATVFGLKLHDQPGFNLLALLAGVETTNLTLPPHNMESSWAGDYPGEFEHLWTEPDRKPYLIHWAGGMLATNAPINALFLAHLTVEERGQWARLMQQRAAREAVAARWPVWARVAAHVLDRADSRFRIAWREPLTSARGTARADDWFRGRRRSLVRAARRASHSLRHGPSRSDGTRQ